MPSALDLISQITATVEPGLRIEDRMREYDLNPEFATIRNGIIVEYRGDVFLNDKNFTKLPLHFVRVLGSFYCDGSHLTTLAGCPKEVDGDFVCSNNRLTSLSGCPKYVGGGFWCSHNRLTSLAGCPEKVGGDFVCNYNRLTSLAGCPKYIGRDFYCSQNLLLSLEGCPKHVSSGFYCYDNPGSDSFKKPDGVGGRFVSNKNVTIATVEPNENENENEVIPNTIIWLAKRVSAQLHGALDKSNNKLEVEIPQKGPYISIFFDKDRRLDGLYDCYIRVAGQLVAGRTVKPDANGLHRVLELYRTMRDACKKIHGMSKSEALNVLATVSVEVSDASAYGFGASGIRQAVRNAVDVSCWRPEPYKYSLGIVV